MLVKRKTQAAITLQYKTNAFPMYAKSFNAGYTKQGANFGVLSIQKPDSILNQDR
jgi:hypothetical protein